MFLSPEKHQTTVENKYKHKLKFLRMNKRSIIWILLLIISSAIGRAQEFTPAVILNIGEENVTADEFWRVYTKNNTKAQAIDPKTIEEYLELYVNFKLKVLEAEKLGYDTIQALNDELNGYRRQLAVPYLTDQEVTDGLINEAYERMGEEIRAYHILLRVEPDAEPSDTLRAYKKLLGIKKKIKNENDFRRYARMYSEDPSAKENEGDLGYFGVFKMVYPFENTAYATGITEISDPVRTNFGYHIIFTKDRRKARGEIRAAHIMVRSKSTDTDEKKAQAKQKIEEIYAQLKAGGSFDALAKQFSDDNGSATNGGDLGWFGTGRMVESFEDVVFSLENNGDFSEPTLTAYGWHIVKRIDWKGVPNLDDIMSEVKRKVTRDGRGVKSKESFISKRKMEYNFSENKQELIDFHKLIDDDYFDRKWKAKEKAAAYKATLFSLEDKELKKEKKEFSQAEFAKFLETNKKYQRRPATPIKQVVNDSYKDWVNSLITQFEDKRLELKFKEFADLMKEYRDGILLFELMNDKIWTAAVKDSTGLQAYYDKNKNQFMWSKRVVASIYTCSDQEIAEKLEKAAKKQLKKSQKDEEVLVKFNQDSQLAVSVKSDKYAKADNKMLDTLPWQVGVSQIKSEDKYYTIVMKEVLEPQPKALNEARGLITAAYQDYLEQEWIKSLREKYPVNISKEALKTLKKREAK